MKEIFYFIRDKEHKPVISVCLLLITDDLPTEVGARGVAICSDSETPCSKLNAHQSNGPGIARRRAWKVWKSGSLYPISRKEVFNILDKVKSDNFRNWEDVWFNGIAQHKAFYHPSLSRKEQRVLAAVKL